MSTVLTIGDVDFDAAEVEECSITPSARRASNSGYHRMGKPNWWARVGDTFMQIGLVRADHECPNIDVAEIIAALGEQRRGVLIVGYGKNGHRDAERESFTIVRHAEAEAVDPIQKPPTVPVSSQSAISGGEPTLADWKARAEAAERALARAQFQLEMTCEEPRDHCSCAGCSLAADRAESGELDKFWSGEDEVK